MTSSDSATLEGLLGTSHLIDETRVLELIVSLGCELVGADEGSILVLDEDAGELVFALTTSPDAAHLVGTRVPIGQGITGLAAATGEVQIGAPSFRPDGQRMGDAHEPEAVIAAPLFSGDALVGALTAVSFVAGRRFGPEEARQYASFGAIAGLVVAQRRLISQLRGQGASGGADTQERRIADHVAALGRGDPQRLAAIADLLGVVLQLDALDVGRP